jgi:hypothetical protein
MLESLIAAALVVHIFVPIVFLFWHYQLGYRSKTHWLLSAVMVSSFLLVMMEAGAAWDWFGFYWPMIFLGVFVLLFIRGSLKLRHLPWKPENHWLAWLSLVLAVCSGALFIWTLPSVFTARNYPQDQALDLAFPLAGGTFHVSHGGSNETMNNHYLVRAQRFALDIVKLNAYGIRARGFLPKDVTNYEIYGNEVVAPCSGDVLAVQNDRPDQIPPQGDTENIAGNHVILYCGGATVLLAHLKQNSVKVKAGEAIGQGHPIGLVGNSGNTSEPHLHIHAVAGLQKKTDEIFFDGKGIPIRFQKRFLIRNDRFENL